MESATTPEKTPPTRRLALLEARLAPPHKGPTTPSVAVAIATSPTTATPATGPTSSPSPSPSPAPSPSPLRHIAPPHTPSPPPDDSSSSRPHSASASASPASAAGARRPDATAATGSAGRPATPRRRLNVTPGAANGTVSPSRAAPPYAPLPQAGYSSDSVHSFSSSDPHRQAPISNAVPPAAPASASASASATAPAAAGAVVPATERMPASVTPSGGNSKRKGVPPPPGVHRVAATKPSAKKRKRMSPCVKRNTRVDDFFKPVSNGNNNNNGTATANGGASAANGNGQVSTLGPTALLFKPIGKSDSNGNGDGNNDGNTNNTGNNNNSNVLNNVLNNGDSHNSGGAKASRMTESADGYRHLRALVDRLTVENTTLRRSTAQVEELREENEDFRTQVEIEMPELRSMVEEKTALLVEAEQRVDNLQKALMAVVVKAEGMRREMAAHSAVQDGERLGRAMVERTGVTSAVAEVWQDGREWRDVQDKLSRLAEERETVERRRKDVARRKKKEGAMAVEGEGGVSLYEESVEYASEVEEICRVRLMVLKREEVALVERRAKLARERDLLVREVHRQRDERQSRFGDYVMLNERYILLNLLGKGGFSEVFKAMDLKEGVYVACKIHQLSCNWSEEKKRNFIKHATREYEIHKSLKHPRVVRLVDIFEIDENSFCTVLEYCDGCDLDSYLRQHKTVGEKEAKSIVGQMFAGLVYLAEQKRRIIHYDLKPGNILLHEGEVQITDFGLSKIMGETEATGDGMELTSQGSGTMWYLPPECFETGNKARITNKVDVWSAGVILYQMLFGRKPFGQDQSQERMFREKTVQKEKLMFPAKPMVSEVAKEFMALCLTRNAAGRPGVRQLLMHPFLRRSK